MIHFKEWLELQEACGTMGCPGHPYNQDSTPTGRAAKIYPHYKKDNKGCSGTTGPCANGGGGGATPAPAAAPAKMAKK